MKTLKTSALFYLLIAIFNGQNTIAQTKIHTEDLVRFYQAFDSTQTTLDTLKQLDFIQKLYADKASDGLKEFMFLRGGNAKGWLKMIQKDKEKLIKIRPLVLSVLNQENEIEKKLKRYKKLYPDFQNGEIYFCIGINNSGGTIKGNHVLIGTEVVADDRTNWAVPIVLHEFSHTQQWLFKNMPDIKSGKIKFDASQILGSCILEGMCDFMGELAYGQSLATFYPEGHTAFGLKHEKIIWEKFKEEMFLVDNNNLVWVYGPKDKAKEFEGEKVKDLGYFLGHQICKSYYNKAKNKKQALKEMFNLEAKTDEVVKDFLIKSGYVSASEIPEIERRFKESKMVK